jgi:hypothetical protein
MTIISSHEIALLEAGKARRDTINMLHDSGMNDAKLLQRLVGQRCKKFDKTYLIADIRYGWDGFIHASGYRILGHGQPGNKVWDIGPITAKAFEDG